MKIFLITFALLVLVFSAPAQQPTRSGVQFDVEDFNKNVAIAEWLVEYDEIAWKTTDEVVKQDKKDLERLGAEWFCFKDKSNVWHAVYGKLGESGYEVVFHFIRHSSGKIEKSEATIDKAFLDRHASALATAREKLTATIPQDSPRFNQYIRQNADKTFSVWMLPAFQTNRIAVYGGEGIYTVDATGKKIIKDESYFQPAFRGFKTEPPREIWLDYKEMKKPSLGAVFFVWYYKPYFTNIFINNESSTSTVVKTDQGYIWVHKQKETESKPKSN
jgi:hypothetical protein